MTTTLEENKKGLLPSTYYRLKQRSLTNVLRKAYNWLRLLSLIPPEVRNFTAEQVNKIARNINEVYVTDNKELHYGTRKLRTPVEFLKTERKI